MSINIKNPENIFRQLTIDLSAWMGYKHKQYDDISLAVVGYNSAGQEAQTLLDIYKHIDSTNITEWNWGLKKIEQPVT